MKEGRGRGEERIGARNRSKERSEGRDRQIVEDKNEGRRRIGKNMGVEEDRINRG